MGIRLTSKILLLQVTRYLGQRRNQVAGWLAMPRVVASVILFGYLVIFIGWLAYSASTQQQPTTTGAPPAAIGSPAQTQAPSLLKRFTDDTGFFLLAWGVIVGVMTYLASHLNKKWDHLILFRGTQKERIRLLDNFEPTPRMIAYFDNRSIYNAIISVLDRLSREPDKRDGKKRYKVCMLLCSPALDYWRNSNSLSASTDDFEWGLEFRDLVSKVVTNSTIEFDICHLPRGSHSGINAMNDFIAVLANYIVQSEDQFKSENEYEADDHFQGVYSSLWHRAEIVAKEFDRWANDEDKKDRFFVKTHTINIPFQIVLVNGEDFKEVVVSFAGREVLERDQKNGVRGFFSTDPHVVETFHHVFNTYVESHGRIPYIPPHTRDVAAKHSESHLIPSFYYDLVGKLHVKPEMFSPVIGNSTKFTVWLLEKLLTTGNPTNDSHWPRKVKKILDVGAGTGVLSLAVGGILRNRCNRTDYSIVALDSCPHAQTILHDNCACDENIDVRPWTLCKDTNQHGEISSSWFNDNEGNRVNIEGEFSEFDLIVGDLPFVHARQRTETDLRFLDLEHQLHQSLMWICNNSKILSEDGLLVTAFSSLGGPEDIADFERHIRENSLQVIQRVDFYESEYTWMVYVLMKKDDYDTHRDRLWWKILDAERRESWTPEKTV